MDGFRANFLNSTSLCTVGGIRKLEFWTANLLVSFPSHLTDKWFQIPRAVHLMEPGDDWCGSFEKLTEDYSGPGVHSSHIHKKPTLRLRCRGNCPKGWVELI
ncbi:hypothetical protein M8J77_021927 [Diaphorina citri]|jgi:hypothetical protein|nr:hypothetical protein M8J77_021927 [Diaphorina citri]